MEARGARNKGRAGLVWALVLSVAFLSVLLAAVYWYPVGGRAGEAASPVAPFAQVEGDVLDINTAAPQELAALPGIGPVKAQAIVDYREARGPIRDLEDLQNVKGIGPKTARGLEGLVVFGPGAGGG